MSNHNQYLSIKDFEILNLLGEGGMGSVFKALDVNLQRTVALKLLHPELAEHEQFRQRFLQEARAAAGLDHQNIIRIYNFHASEDSEHMYLVMEFVPGGSLRTFLDTYREQNRQVEIPLSLQMIEQVASALDYAHQRGMVHRDVKPDNVLIKRVEDVGGTRLIALLTDFGLVKLLDNTNLVKTQMNKPLGTLPYMAPEQFSGGIDKRVDIYALGIMMYEILVGQLPFLPHSPHEAINMHLNVPPPPPRIYRTDLPPGLEAIILKALAKEPERRYQTCAELIQAIRHEMSGGRAPIPPTPFAVPTFPEQAVAAPPPLPLSVAPSSEDRIVIQRDGHAPVIVNVTKPTLMIGRDPKHDIPLPGERVSRNHMRIIRQPDGSFYVTDLNSTNGSFLQGVRLAAHIPELWQPEQLLMVGEYQLVLQSSSGDPESTAKHQPH